jgi:hypothetical protein
MHPPSFTKELTLTFTQITWCLESIKIAAMRAKVEGRLPLLKQLTEDLYTILDHAS